MEENISIVVTSIAIPNQTLQSIAKGCLENDYNFIVIGDVASPPNFHLDGCRFYSLTEQYETHFRLAKLCPIKHYSRKNLGYLIAAQNGAKIIIDTDDDNIPNSEFWEKRSLSQFVPVVSNGGWVNIYRYFSKANIWPRGLPLDCINNQIPLFESLPVQTVDCPIQQGLVNENPDVDAIFRLVSTLPQSFSKDRRVALGYNSWSPFNSQNTSWWQNAFPLLYLPSFCSFRMTDIWRSFIAQRIIWANDGCILFHEPNIRQERNVHNLMLDFEEEIPGYLNNKRICEALEKLDLQSGFEKIGENLMVCYEKLVSIDIIDKNEIKLVKAWLYDLESI